MHSLIEAVIVFGVSGGLAAFILACLVHIGNEA